MLRSLTRAKLSQASAMWRAEGYSCVRVDRIEQPQSITSKPNHFGLGTAAEGSGGTSG